MRQILVVGGGCVALQWRVLCVACIVANVQERRRWRLSILRQAELVKNRRE